MTFTEQYGLVPYPANGKISDIRRRYPPVNGTCEMPGCPYKDRTGYLAQLVYDHCHQCGYIRGTVCGYCNRDCGRYEVNIPYLGTGHKIFDEYLTRCPCNREDAIM